MKYLALSCLVAGTIAVAPVLAAAPADAPAGTMGVCKDGTYSSSADKKGACRGHKGVKDWYESSTASDKPKMAEPASVGARATAAAPSSTMTAPATPTGNSMPASISKTSGMPTAQAPGGGAGQVWGNDSSKVYHCSGDKWYGKTKHGEYMSESDAKSKGFHADHGKACG